MQHCILRSSCLIKRMPERTFVFRSLVEASCNKPNDFDMFGSTDSQRFNYQSLFKSRQASCIPCRRLQQRRIAEILSTVDEAIEQTEALIAKYQQIKAGLMHDLFTRGVTPDGHLRPTRTQAPHLLQRIPPRLDSEGVGDSTARFRS